MQSSKEQLLAESRRVDMTRLTALQRLGRLRDGQVSLNGERYGVITHDTSIGDGVYIGSGMLGAAIRVDVTTDPMLQCAYQRFRPAFERIADGDSRRKTEGLLGLAALVATTMPYRDEYVSMLDRKDGYLFADKRTQRVRPLGEFATGGVCRHQALMLGSLLDQAHDKGVVSGEVRFMSTHSQQVGPHAFVMYEEAEKTWLLDPAVGVRSQMVVPLHEQVLPDRYVPIAA